MEAGSCQPLAKHKGAHREMESEGSVMSKVPTRGTRIISGMQVGRVCISRQNPINCTDTLHVNMAGTWDESYVTLPWEG
jgi:hypothetical protein